MKRGPSLRVSIRRARPDDAERIVRLHYDAVHENASKDYPPAVLDSWSPHPDENRFSWMRSQILEGHNSVLVAELPGGAIGGFCVFSPSEGFIYAVYVAPQRARSGIGRRLLRFAEASLTKQEVGQARLKASKNAVGFYTTEGYTLIEPTTQDLADGSEMECLEMRKDLDAAT